LEIYKKRQLKNHYIDLYLQGYYDPAVPLQAGRDVALFNHALA